MPSCRWIYVVLTKLEHSHLMTWYGSFKYNILYILLIDWLRLLFIAVILLLHTSHLWLDLLSFQNIQEFFQFVALLLFQEFSGVVGLTDSMELQTDMSKVPVRTMEILASCHALVFVDNKLVCM